jgi:hypothetical protein
MAALERARIVVELGQQLYGALIALTLCTAMRYVGFVVAARGPIDVPMTQQASSRKMRRS